MNTFCIACPGNFSMQKSKKLQAQENIENPLPSNNGKKRSLWQRLFLCKGEERTEPQKKKKKSFWSYFRKSNKVSPEALSQGTNPQPGTGKSQTIVGKPVNNEHQTKTDTKKEAKKETIPIPKPVPKLEATKAATTEIKQAKAVATMEGAPKDMTKTYKKMEKEPETKTATTAGSVATKNTANKYFGFPNLGFTCYMNSCLQSLLKLEDFMTTITEQKEVWSLLPDARLMWLLMKIQETCNSDNLRVKWLLLKNFKQQISLYNDEFFDDTQKDAHEFLITILNYIRNLKPELEMKAAINNKSYSCPVDNHMAFTIKNTRTCKECGDTSTSTEEHTILSLNMLPKGGSVDGMLDEFMKKTEVDYNCACGSTRSIQQASFMTLPNVLILHLKRFMFDKSYRIMKLCNPVTLNRNLEVSGACYNLISMVSHSGQTAQVGHYVSDGMDHSVNQLQSTSDRWLTYNDLYVKETTGTDVCKEQQRTSYILFYVGAKPIKYEHLPNHQRRESGGERETGKESE